MNDHPETQITVITGAGRFFSAGADVKETAARPVQKYDHETEKKLDIWSRLSNATILIRQLIQHKKVLVLALNGPAVGGGAAWFPGLADIVIASKTTYLQCPFAALGLVPEFGSVANFRESIGVHRANDFLMFGRKLSVDECERWGLVNYVFENDGFHQKVVDFLEGQLKVNDGESMMEHKRLMNSNLIPARLLALHDSVDALTERFVADAPAQRFAEKGKLMNGVYIIYCFGMTY